MRQTGEYTRDQATEWKQTKYSAGFYNRRYLFGDRILAAGFHG
jgi:hypothetical protein